MFQKTKRDNVCVLKNCFPNCSYLGLHLIAEFWYGKKIESKKELKRILICAAKKAQSTPLKVSIHKFKPQGITGVILVSESHIALHSWPEYNYLAVDIFTCGKKSMPYKALEYLKEEFKPKKLQVREIKRGILGEESF